MFQWLKRKLSQKSSLSEIEFIPGWDFSGIGLERHLYSFSDVEVRALYRLLEKEWIPREDDEANAVMSRIVSIVKSLENAKKLDRPDS